MTHNPPKVRLEATYYLAGPMSGIPQFNYPAFAEAAAILRKQGMKIISPHEHDTAAYQAMAWKAENGTHDETPGFTWADCLAKDVKLVADECDGVIVLPNWQRSRGARLEVFVAITCNKPIFRFLTYDIGHLIAVDPRYAMTLIAKEVAPL